MDEMEELEQTVQKGRETEAQMRQRLERLQKELENTNKRIE
jgi:cell division protein ZapA (FtsZ GTPase activity inhibitor)